MGVDKPKAPGMRVPSMTPEYCHYSLICGACLALHCFLVPPRPGVVGWKCLTSPPCQARGGSLCLLWRAQQTSASERCFPTEMWKMILIGGSWVRWKREETQQAEAVLMRHTQFNIKGSMNPEFHRGWKSQKRETLLSSG